MITRVLTEREIEGKLIDLFDESATALELPEILNGLGLGPEMDQIVLEVIWQLIGRGKLTLTRDRKFTKDLS